MLKRVSFLLLAISIPVSSDLQTSLKPIQPHNEVNNWIKVVESLNDYEYCALEELFKVILGEFSGGYVLYGNKPVCTLGVSDSPIAMDTAFLKQGILLSEGVEVWNKLSKRYPNLNYTLLISERRHAGWRDFNLINNQAFIKVVRENLPLFQYVLGPEVTPESLLIKLQDRKEDLGSVLKDDKVLIGIVLGYGTQNALVVSRQENLQDFLYSTKEQLPFKVIQIRKNLQVFSKEEFARWPKERKLSLFMPSFGYRTLEQEAISLKQKVFYTPDLLQEHPPLIPWFGYIENDETSHLLHHYFLVQKEIRKVLSTDHILESVSAKIFNEKVSINALLKVNQRKNTAVSHLRKMLQQEKKLGFILGQALREDMKEQNSIMITNFLEGMNANHKDGKKPCTDDYYHSLKEAYFEIQKRYSAKMNLDEAESFIKQIANEKGIMPIIPQKIYQHIVKPGNGEKIKNLDAIATINITISNMIGNILHHENLLDVKLDELLPGLIHGMQGMQIGEIRKIYIHPEYGYGNTSNFEPNIGLVAQIELLKIGDHGEGNGSIVPCIITNEKLSGAELKLKLDIACADLAYHYGVRTWQHFSKERYLCNFDETLRGFREPVDFRNCPLSQNDISALTKLQWLLFQN